jgi:CRISPR/Cas system-associated endonuclease Cas3-HD
MNEHVERVATAALFHDIGKFWSRTGASRPYTQQEADHFGTYAHALWSAAFVEKWLGNGEMAACVHMRKEGRGDSGYEPTGLPKPERYEGGTCHDRLNEE